MIILFIVAVPAFLFLFGAWLYLGWNAIQAVRRSRAEKKLAAARLEEAARAERMRAVNLGHG